MDNLMGSLRSRNISAIICERIVSGILAGELAPGAKLPTEDEFAQRIGAGKSSVREAIKILEAMGVLEIRRADGTYVADRFRGSMLDQTVYGVLLTPHNTADLLSFKVQVQKMAVLDALESPDGGAASAFAHMNEACAACPATDGAALLNAAEALERAVLDATRNPLVRELYRQAIAIAQRPWSDALASFVHACGAQRLHAWLQAFCHTLEDGDCKAAEALLDRAQGALVSPEGAESATD